jgi:hypothetical protein
LKDSENVEGDVELKDTICIPFINGRSCNTLGTAYIVKLKFSRDVDWNVELN